MYYVLKSSDVLEVLVPILYHLNDSRADQCKYIPFAYLPVITYFPYLVTSFERNPDFNLKTSAHEF